MKIDELKAELTGYQARLADFHQEKGALEDERQRTEADKRRLRGLALIDHDEAAERDLRAANGRLLEIGQRLEDLAGASAELVDRISAVEAHIEIERKRAAAAEGVELVREQIKRAQEAEEYLSKAAESFKALQDMSTAISQKAREVDAEAANDFTSKTLRGRLEERLAVHFKPFGCRELVFNRDVPLPEQFQGVADFFGKYA